MSWFDKLTMNMKRGAYFLPGLLTITLLLLVMGPAVAQRKCDAALKASEKLAAVLISRDTVSIKKLVDPAIGYGHSNGWIESRADMIRDLYDGMLQYHVIRLLDTPGCRLAKRTAIVRHRIAVAIEMNGLKLEMNLGVLQIWERQRRKWMLIARQSCKIP